MRLSLVIPCYNEAKNLPLLVARLRETFVRDDIEAILVDNGSTDDSPAVLAALLGIDDATLATLQADGVVQTARLSEPGES